MNHGKAYAEFQRDMAVRGFTQSPLTKSQFLFLSRDCGLARHLVDSVAMDVASGGSMRYAVLVAIEAARVDEGLAVRD